MWMALIEAGAWYGGRTTYGEQYPQLQAWALPAMVGVGVAGTAAYAVWATRRMKREKLKREMLREALLLNEAGQP